MEQTKSYPNGRCCVFQPFDNGVFDKRFEDVLAPAIAAAGMEPYRVDRDLGSTIPIDTLHQEIRSSAICIADITTRNPNVMYELGFAIAAGKDTVIICGPSPEKYPFDIQHRGIIGYETGSPSDFAALQSTITQKLTALIERQQKIDAIAELSPVKNNDGLLPHEQTALAITMANSDYAGDYIAARWLKDEMRKQGYSDIGTRVAVAKLVKLGHLKVDEMRDMDGDPFTIFRITEKGEDWLLDNQSLFELKTYKRSSDTEIKDDGIPF